MTARNMFQRRHYDFLVHWAATSIKPTEVASLADLLAVDNPSFDRKRFLKTYVELRRFAQRQTDMGDGGAVAAWLMPASPEAVEAANDILGPKYGQTHSPPSSLVPVACPEPVEGPDMGAYLRRHADANRGRGMWEYTRCWKCDSGRRPDLCPVGCRGACEYPSAVND